MTCEHKWRNVGIVGYERHRGYPNEYLFQCGLCKDIKIVEKEDNLVAYKKDVAEDRESDSLNRSHT